MARTPFGRIGKVGRLALLLAILAPALLASAQPVAADRRGERRAPVPVIDANFADPDILQVGRVFHAYATNVAAIRLYESLGFRLRCPVHVATIVASAAGS